MAAIEAFLPAAVLFNQAAQQDVIHRTETDGAVAAALRIERAAHEVEAADAKEIAWVWLQRPPGLEDRHQAGEAVCCQHGEQRAGQVELKDEAEMVEPLTEHPCHGAANCVRSQPHVRVREEEKLALSLLCAEVERVIFTQPAGRQFLDVNNAQLRMPRRHALQQLRRGIGGAVVENDDL